MLGAITVTEAWICQGLHPGQSMVQVAGTVNPWKDSKLLATFLRKYDRLMGEAEGGESRQKQGHGFLRNSSPPGSVTWTAPLQSFIQPAITKIRVFGPWVSLQSHE